MLTAEAVARARARTAKHFMVTAPVIDCCKGHWALLLFIISTLSQASTCAMTLTFSDFDKYKLKAFKDKAKLFHKDFFCNPSMKVIVIEFVIL